MNDSSTGGYIYDTAPPILADQNLNRFIHGVISGITDLSDTLVRPMWFKNPQPTPNIDTDWVSYGITNVIADANPYQVESSDGLTENFIRHETFDVPCIFYGPNAQYYASNLRDGLYLTQNNEILYSVGMGLVTTDTLLHVPELINDLYYNRIDFSFTIRREVKRTYPILSFLSVYGQIQANSGENQDIIENFEITE